MKFRAFELIAPDKWLFSSSAEVQKSAARAAEFAARNFKFENLEHHVAEYLRQWIAAELIENYGYPENWLWMTSGKRNANLAVKDGENQLLALIAAGYFGDSDADFEQAVQDLQNDLSTYETARFGIVTDGKRIAFPLRSEAGFFEKAVDFPAFNELKIFDEMGFYPKIKQTTQKFQKLPTAKHLVEEVSATPKPIQQPVKVDYQTNNVAPAKKKTSLLTFLVVTLLLIFVGIPAILIFAVGYTNFMAAREFNRNRLANQNQNSVTARESVVTPRQNAAETDAPSKIRAVAPEKNQTTAKNQDNPKPNQKSNPKPIPKSDAKLNNYDAAIMGSRPAMNPNAKQAETKVAAKPEPQPTVAPNQKKRIIINSPY